MNLQSIWILGFPLNLFLFYSIFQIYFQSHLVQIPVSHGPTGTAEVDVKLGIKRIVFIVGDGLRADTFYQHPELHPRLTSLIKSGRSVWGISDTRVPTESRPGHVALFAGVYEDPSAIFTGWQQNLVEFDSVFNRTRSSLALGSPDIIPMFANGAGRERIHGESYPKDWLDFQQSNFEHLDTWVLDKLKFLAMRDKLPKGDKALLFLHLCGIDTAGHATKPHSKNYLNNVRHVDNLIVEIEKLVANYYEDSETTFIFTSDHGMTDWGSHGSGSLVETETPFVIWGPGIKGSHSQIRLKQPDFAAISSGLLSIPFPTNSIGRFPIEILENVDPNAYHILLGNFEQIQELMNAKKLTVTSGLIPFVLYHGEMSIDELAGKAKEFFEQRLYSEAINCLNEGIDLLLTGIKYYERYDQELMFIFVILTFGLWMSLIVLTLLFPIAAKHTSPRIKGNHLIDLGLSGIITKGVLGWSLWRIPYTLVPFYLGRIILNLVKSYRKEKIEKDSITSSPKIKSLLVLGLATIIGTQILVLTFYEPRILTLGLILNSFWVWIPYDNNRRRKTESKSTRNEEKSTWEMLAWFGSNGILALFPMSPAIGKNQSPIFITLGPLFSSLLAIILLRILKKETGNNNRVYMAQVGILLSVCLLIHFPEFVFTRFIAWISIVLSILLPTSVLSTQLVSLQLLSIFLGISVPFSFLSLSYESLYFPFLYITLLILLKFEMTTTTNEVEEWKEFLCTKLPKAETNELEIKKSNPVEELGISFRRAWLHLFFTYLSFFGIGNFGSISSFDPSSVRCFVSIFSPFLMMTLLLVKTIGPFLLVTSSFKFLLRRREDVEQNFTILLLLCQGIALTMFFNVTNEGSWLEIGTSISHYVIVQTTTLFLFLLHILASFLTTSTKLNLKDIKWVQRVFLSKTK